MKLISAFSLCLLISCASWAGGAYIGSGGDAIVCTQISAGTGDDGFSGEKIVKAWTLEYYFASRTQNPAKLANLKKWDGLTESQTLDRLMKPLMGTEIYDSLSESLTTLEPIEMGFASEQILKDVNDSWNPFDFGDSCQQVQAVVRMKDIFVYDLNVWNLLGASTSGQQRAFMTFHEHLYKYAKEVRHHETSVNTMMLIVYLLTDDGPAKDLQQKLKTYEFID